MYLFLYSFMYLINTVFCSDDDLSTKGIWDRAIILI